MDKFRQIVRDNKISIILLIVLILLFILSLNARASEVSDDHVSSLEIIITEEVSHVEVDIDYFLHTSNSAGMIPNESFLEVMPYSTWVTVSVFLDGGIHPTADMYSVNTEWPHLIGFFLAPFVAGHSGIVMDYLAIDPKREGYVFGGWIDQDGNAFSSSLLYSESLTIIAQWIGGAPVDPPSQIDPEMIKEIKDLLAEININLETLVENNNITLMWIIGLIAFYTGVSIVILVAMAWNRTT